MSALKIVQGIAKAAKVICSILIVLYLVAMIASGIGLAETFFPSWSLKMGDVVVDEFLRYDGALSASEIRVVLAGGLVVGAGELLLLFWLDRYLKRELAAGTPFTMEGAKELLWLGIKALIVFASVMAICCVMRLIVFGNTELEGIETDGLLLARHGLELILLSVLFRYGAEEKKKGN